MSNIDIEIGEGNAGAVGVRGTYAQHCFLAHMDFRIGSGLAGVHDTGNVMEDVRFFGGHYGIWTRTPSPGWQFTAVDVVLRGPARGGHPRDGGRPHADPPALPRTSRRPISIDDGSPGRTLGEGRAHGGHRAARPSSSASSRTPRTQINMENVVCRRVPTFALFRESGKKVLGPGEIYEVRAFSHGLHYRGHRRAPGAMKDVFDAVAARGDAGAGAVRPRAAAARRARG